MKSPFSAPERLALLQEFAAAARDRNAAMDNWRFAEGQLLLSRLHQLQAEYFNRLPRIAMGCCPFDNQPLVRTFDPFGFDGPWWRPDASPAEVPACPHFCCLRGAVDLRKKKPVGGGFQVHTGPQAPCIIPRLLQLDGMAAVLSQREMAHGQLVYLIAYFSRSRPPAAQLAANWPRTLHAYTNALGNRAWRPDREDSDFDLLPWLENGKLRWCDPGDTSVLSSAPPSSCPFLNAPGPHQPMIIQGDRAWEAD